MKRILVLAPHTDDAELGCGASIARFAEDGLSVHVAVFSSAEDSLPAGAPKEMLKNEFFRAIPLLGVRREEATVLNFPVRRLSYHRQEVLEEMIRLRAQFNPDTVLLPSAADVHQDHQVVHSEGVRAFKDISVLGYELPWNHFSFATQCFIAVEERHVLQKVQALQEYRSQLEMGRTYFSEDFITGWARMRGTQVRVAYAEVFDILRLRI